MSGARFQSLPGLGWAEAWDPHLNTPFQRLVLNKLASFMDTGLECWPTVATLAELVGGAERSVTRTLSQLRDYGVLEIAGRGPNGQRKYHGLPFPPPDWETRRPHRKRASPIASQGDSPVASRGDSLRGQGVTRGDVAPDSTGQKGVTPSHPNNHSTINQKPNHPMAPHQASCESSPPRAFFDPEDPGYDEAYQPGYDGPVIDDDPPDDVPEDPHERATRDLFGLTPPPKPTTRPRTAQARQTDAPSLTAEAMRKTWNEIMTGTPIERALVMTDKREKGLRRLARVPCEGRITVWRTICQQIAADPWCRGEKNGAGHENWVASLDWITRPNSDWAVKMLERAAERVRRHHASMDEINGYLPDDDRARDLDAVGLGPRSSDMPPAPGEPGGPPNLSRRRDIEPLDRKTLLAIDRRLEEVLGPVYTDPAMERRMCAIATGLLWDRGVLPADQVNEEALPDRHG